MLTVQQLKAGTEVDRKTAAENAVKAADNPAEKKDVAKAAVDALSADQRSELIKSIFPADSADRRWVYIAGFGVAGAVAVGLGLVAWAAQSGTNSISASLVVLATGFSSAILGGLLGAYVQR